MSDDFFDDNGDNNDREQKNGGYDNGRNDDDYFNGSDNRRNSNGDFVEDGNNRIDRFNREPNFDGYDENGRGYYRRPKSNGMGTASMVLGIVGLVMTCCWYLAIPLAVVGLVLGIVQCAKNKTSAAIAGVVLCAITLLFAVTVGIISIVYQEELLKIIDEMDSSVIPKDSNSSGGGITYIKTLLTSKYSK